MEKIKKTIELRKEVYEKLEAIKAKRFISNDTAALVYAIVETYEREVNNYKEIIKLKATRAPLTEQEKALKKVERNQADRKLRVHLMNETARKICESLGGTEVNNDNGTFGCEYFMYEKINAHRVMSGRRLIPYELLTEEHINTQYKGGTKKEIEKILASKK